jgi:hypothetical protein
VREGGVEIVAVWAQQIFGQFELDFFFSLPHVRIVMDNCAMAVATTRTEVHAFRKVCWLQVNCTHWLRGDIHKLFFARHFLKVTHWLYGDFHRLFLLVIFLE